jgi:SPW repeat
MDKRQNNAANPLPHEAAGASWVNVLFGIWIIMSPYVLSVTHYPQALWNNVICGIVIVLLALIRTLAPRQTWWSWTNVLMGVWLIISPFVLAMTTIVLWNNIVIGTIIAFAAWANASIESEVTA